MDEPKGVFTQRQMMEITKEKGVGEGLKSVMKEIAKKMGIEMGEKELGHFMKFLEEADADLEESWKKEKNNKEIDMKKLSKLIKDDEVSIQLMFMKNILLADGLKKSNQELSQLKATVSQIEAIQEKKME